MYTSVDGILLPVTNRDAPKASFWESDSPSENAKTGALLYSEYADHLHNGSDDVAEGGDARFSYRCFYFHGNKASVSTKSSAARNLSGT